MSYADAEYDVYAVLDSVPQVVSDLDRPGSRFSSLLAAFFGLGSPAFGDDTELRQ